MVDKKHPIIMMPFAVQTDRCIAINENREDYFSINSIKKQDGGYYKASFRGRKMFGQTIDVDSLGYQGVVVSKPLVVSSPPKEDASNADLAQPIQLKPNTKSFKSFTYFNLDKHPSENDCQRILFENYAPIAKLLHASVTSLD